MEETVVKIAREICLFMRGTLVARSSAEIDLKKTDAQATIAAYQHFLPDHPHDSRAEQVRNKIHASEGRAGMDAGGKTDTAHSFKQYV
jgi:hypothetical protein